VRILQKFICREEQTYEIFFLLPDVNQVQMGNLIPGLRLVPEHAPNK
jgi:hypothetical protein